MPVKQNLSGRTVACIATGPSLTQQQVESAGRFIRFGCNNVWTLCQLDYLYACNLAWWEFYWSDELERYPAEKWTANREAHEKFGVNWIAEKDRKGLSTDPEFIHHGHGSGYSMLNLAFLMGASRILLLGYDLKYASDYSGADRRVGSGPRHFFGEYPSALQHWPKVSVRNGVHVELVELYESVAKQGLVEILNATPGSALQCFPKVDIDAL